MLRRFGCYALLAGISFMGANVQAQYTLDAPPVPGEVTAPAMVLPNTTINEQPLSAGRPVNEQPARLGTQPQSGSLLPPTSAPAAPNNLPTTITAPTPAAQPVATPQPGMGALENVRRTPIARVTTGAGTLPNEQGQIWREYDISPYTQSQTGVARSESVLVDWILRDTGYEAWHGDVPSMLNADARVLRVYHTPEMQRIVGEIVDRFVRPESTGEAFGLRLISIGSPAWRARAATILKSVKTETPGLQAWVVAKEDAAILVTELRKRTDYREHSNPQQLAVHGRQLKSVSLRPRPYTQGFQVGQDLWQGPLPLTAQVEEGHKFEFMPLLGIDGRTVEAVVHCDIDQVEKMHSVPLEVTNVNGARVNLEVPQMSARRIQERFRWPVDQILIIGLGMIPNPTPTESGGLLDSLVTTAPPRVDLLLFIEPRGKLPAAGTQPATTAPSGSALDTARGGMRLSPPAR